MEALAVLRQAYASATAAAQARHAGGQRVVGYFCDSIPIELIEAAGALPVRITGYPAPSQAVLDQRLTALLPKAFWQVRQSSLEFINHAFGRLVDGTYAMLDALVIPNTRKPLINLYGQLKAAQADDPSLHLPHLFVLDRDATPCSSAHAFNHESVAIFRAELERWSGTTITDGAIDSALARRHAIAADLRAIMMWRRMERPGISGTDVLAVIGAGMFIPAEEYAPLVRALRERGPQPGTAGPRIFMGGSPPDNDRLYRQVEAMGATIVGEDHCWGERQVEFGEAGGGGGLAHLAQRWDAAPPCGFRLPVDATCANLVNRARASGADGVILNVFRNDEMQIWDTPPQLAALREAGIPALHLAEQPHIPGDEPGLVARVAPWLASLGTVAA